MRVFFSLLNNVLPYKRVCNKEDLVNSSNLQSILFKVLRGVYRSSLNVGQRRRKCEVDSIFKPQLQIAFKKSWKLCLNLCSRKWTLLYDDNLISELQKSLLKLFGRNFDVDKGRHHTLTMKLFLLGKFISSQIHSNSLISKSVLLLNGTPSYI